MAKQCSTCKDCKPETDFYADKRRPDGMKSQCKKCHCITSVLSRDGDAHRDYNRNWMRRSKYASRADVKERELKRSRVRGKSIEARARHLANVAVRLGFLERPATCPICGEQGMGIHAHHDDYSRPLDVRWMCTECHGKEHRCAPVQERAA